MAENTYGFPWDNDPNYIDIDDTFCCPSCGCKGYCQPGCGTQEDVVMWKELETLEKELEDAKKYTPELVPFFERMIKSCKESLSYKYPHLNEEGYSI